MIKNTIALIFLTFWSMGAQAQDTTLTYFNDDWEETQKSEASYYRKAFKGEAKRWQVIDYYIDGSKQMEGTFKSKKLKKEHGHFTYFFESGKISNQGTYKKGVKDGEWKWYLENGSVCSTEKYKKGKLLDYTFWNLDGSPMDKEVPYEVKAEFIGGEDGLMKYLSQSVKYPKEAQQNGVQGRVHVRFVIGKDGSIGDVSIKREVHPDLDNEAMRVIKEMPNWIPGKYHNRPAKVTFLIPVNFVLQ